MVTVQRFQQSQYADTNVAFTESRGWGLFAAQNVQVQ